MTQSTHTIFLLAVSAVNSQSSAIDLIAVQVSHGILGRVRILKFAKAEALGTTSLAVLNNSTQFTNRYTNYTKCHDDKTLVSQRT